MSFDMMAAGWKIAPIGVLPALYGLTPAWLYIRNQIGAAW